MVKDKTNEIEKNNASAEAKNPEKKQPVSDKKGKNQSKPVIQQEPKPKQEKPKQQEAKSDVKKIEQEKPKKQENSLVERKESGVVEQQVPTKSSNVVSIYGILIGSFILLLLLAFLIFSFIVSNNKNIFSGIYIKEINVSDLSKEDAKSKLDMYVKNNLPEEIILIHDDYEATLNTAELNINFDIDSAVDTAYNIGRDSNFFINSFNVLGTFFSNKNVDPVFTLDEDILTEKLNDISSKLPDKVIESGYYIDGNNLILSKGSSGNVIDINQMKKRLKDEINNLNVSNKKIQIITKNAEPSKLDIEKIYEEVHKDPVDATFSREPLSVTPSKNGVDFDISLEEASSKLEESSEECSIPLKVIYPNVTTNMIGTEAFPDQLSNFSTYYAASNVNRTTNLRLAASKINGTVIMPGETFSYNQVVGERTIAAGYKEAPIYVEGRVEDGLGGGICQITTTLYNAVVYANLEIVERTNHQFVPSYIGAGRDATVVYGALDFKFKNNRDYPIKIICSVSGGVANFQILGLRTDNDYQVEIYSTITSQTASSTNSATYKILKQDGNIVDQVLLSRDTYKRH